MDKPRKETVPRKNGRLTAKEATKRLPRGRPKGAVNKATIFKEVIREGFEKTMEKDAKKVINAVVEKAIEGDMQAAKLLLDRILPTTKAVDLDQLENSKGLTISINVGELTGHPDLIDGDIIESN